MSYFPIGIDMRFFTLFIATNALILLNSCDGGKKTFSRYEIVNDTNHKIVLKSYDRLNDNLQKTIQMVSRGDKWESERFQTSEPGGGVLTPDIVLKGDSIRIEFDAERLIIYIGEYSERNILYEENYKIQFLNNENSVRRFTFTEQDYENAE